MEQQDKNYSQLVVANQIADRLKELHEGKKFHQFQLNVIKAIFEQGKKRIFIRKGRKGGGTETVLYPAARIAGMFPNRGCYIIGPTQRLQSEIMWDNRRLHNYLPRSWNVTFNEKDKRARLPNGSFIKVEGANDPEAARGFEGDIFVWDEFKDHNVLSYENCYPNVMSRDAIVIVLGTPPTTTESHYYVLEQTIKNDPDWAFFHWTAWDNPFLPGGHTYLQKEKEKYYAQGRGYLWEIEYEAKYVFNAINKVLPCFTEEHIYPREVIMELIARDKDHLKWVCAIDPGYATCFAVLFVAFNPYTSQIFILDEIYSPHRSQNSVRSMWPLIESRQKLLCESAFAQKRWTTIYDSAALGFAVEVHAHAKEQGRKVSLWPTEKQKDDEDTFFRTINESFSEKGRVMVARNCANFVKEVRNYETDEHGNYPDKNNHLLDDARYIYKYLGYHHILKQGEAPREKEMPRGFTPEEDLQREKEKHDFVGFGGINANFDINNVLI